MYKATVIGWDVGGANLKAVALNAEGEVLQAVQIPCALWKDLDQLQNAVKSVHSIFEFSTMNIDHIITMTGELVDFFPNRHTGVIAIADLLNRLLSPNRPNIQFYAANQGFVGFEQVLSTSMMIASANWYASASVLANHYKDALLVDIGSTTTDIIPIACSKVDTNNIRDAERLQTDHLVYTGVVRTPIIALGNKVIFNGIETNVAAEYFATMADVYRLTGELPHDADMADTADGKGKSTLESARRLARMIGYDVEDKPMEVWRDFALVCRNMQIAQIKAAVLKHLKPNVPIIGAGAGAFLVRQIADAFDHPYLSATQALQKDLSHHLALELCFPAYAVAKLYWISNQFQLKQSSHA